MTDQELTAQLIDTIRYMAQAPRNSDDQKACLAMLAILTAANPPTLVTPA